MEESLKVLEEGVQRTKELNGSKEGMIHLAYIYTLGSTFVPKMVRRFLDAYPDYHIEFHFIVGTTGDILEGLKNDRYDMVFSSYQDGEPDIDFRQIGDQKLVLAVPKDHPLAMYDSVDLKIRWIIHRSIFRREADCARLSIRCMNRSVYSQRSHLK